MAFLNEMEEVDDSEADEGSSELSDNGRHENDNNLVAKPTVTKTTQIELLRDSQFESKHGYSNSQPDNY